VRKLFLLFSAILISAGVASAEVSWLTDFDAARAKAKSDHKLVLLDFTGSDWCGPCIQLRKTVFSRPEFRAYADKNLVLVEIDYPQRKKQSAELKAQNEKLSKQYGIDEKGFPTVMLLDPAGKVIRELTGYDGETTAGFIAWIEGKSKP
jgi:protein disulfide-isomerase